MLTRVFLAAGVAALAIATPAMAGPGGHGGGGGQHGGGGPPHGGGGPGGGGPHGGGGPRGGPMVMGGGGHGGGHWGGGGPAFMGARGGGHSGGGARFGAPQMRASQMHGFARQQYRGAFATHQSRMSQRQPHGSGRQQFRMAQRQHVHGFGRQQFRMAQHQQSHGRGQQQFRMSQRQAHGFAGGQGHGYSRQQARLAARGQLSGMGPGRQQALAGRQFNAQQFGSGRFGGNAKGGYQQSRGNAAQLAGNQFGANQLGGRQFGNRGNFNATPYSALAYGNNVQVMPFSQANRFIGAPLAQVAGIAALAPLPATLQYLYPETADYYYRYGDGYLYQVDRGTDLIAALIPLLAGGFLPGQYLPVTYMADYVPDNYGFNAFYPDYGGLCNRYYGGVIYQVDCDDGYVEDVIPMYAGGYGVGELLPTAYSYYNVPLQYRGLYYDTPDAAYWYSPGAIYQYDPRTDVITSVAALMGPGLAIGQPLPAGYTVYNVPYAYRAAYYDTPGAWYRYSNGYIYQVDPATQLVTAIVASLLT